MAYGFVALISYGIWCEEVRRVDIGITGDSWVVPVGNGYSLIMVDQTDHASLEKDGSAIVGRDSSGRNTTLSGITDISSENGKVTGKDGNGFFVLDINSARVSRYQDLESASQEFVAQPSIESVSYFYWSRRWGWPDLVAFGFFCLPAIGLLLTWYRYVVRSKNI